MYRIHWVLQLCVAKVTVFYSTFYVKKVIKLFYCVYFSNNCAKSLYFSTVVCFTYFFKWLRKQRYNVIYPQKRRGTDCISKFATLQYILVAIYHPPQLQCEKFAGCYRFLLQIVFEMYKVSDKNMG